jgi:hypothetical protein
MYEKEGTYFVHDMTVNVHMWYSKIGMCLEVCNWL